MISENTISKKRGRPAALTPEQKALFERAFPELKTVKSLQNKWFMGRAIHVTRNQAGLEWLLGGENHFVKQTILFELGRVKHDADLLTLARDLCELKPTSRESIYMIRNWRFRKDHGS